MDRPLRLIVNPHAGGGRALRALPAVEARLRDLGFTVRTEQTRDLDHGRALAVEAHESGELPVAFSGDGLIGAVAGALSGRPGATLGILPGGRGNDFARVLGLPLEPVEACDALAAGRPRTVDVGLADGRPFIGIASLGFDSDANRIANEAPSRLGTLVYVYGALRALVAWRPATFTVDVDGTVRTFTGWSVGAANSKAYGGGMYAAPSAELDDGALDVVLAHRTGKLRFLLQVLPRVFKGTHVDLPEIDVLRGAVVRIDADRPFVVYADGDPIAELPVTLTVAHDALQVVVPA